MRKWKICNGDANGSQQSLLVGRCCQLESPLSICLDRLFQEMLATDTTEAQISAKDLTDHPLTFVQTQNFVHRAQLVRSHQFCRKRLARFLVIFGALPNLAINSSRIFLSVKHEVFLVES